MSQGTPDRRRTAGSSTTPIRDERTRRNEIVRTWLVRMTPSRVWPPSPRAIGTSPGYRASERVPARRSAARIHGTEVSPVGLADGVFRWRADEDPPPRRTQ